MKSSLKNRVLLDCLLEHPVSLIEFSLLHVNVTDVVEHFPGREAVLDCLFVESQGAGLMESNQAVPLASCELRAIHPLVGCLGERFERQGVVGETDLHGAELAALEPGTAQAVMQLRGIRVRLDRLVEEIDSLFELPAAVGFLRAYRRRAIVAGGDSNGAITSEETRGRC